MSCKRCGVPLPKGDKDETVDYCGYCYRKLFRLVYPFKSFKIKSIDMANKLSIPDPTTKNLNQEWINRTKEQVIRELRENLKA